MCVLFGSSHHLNHLDLVFLFYLCMCPLEFHVLVCDCMCVDSDNVNSTELVGPPLSSCLCEIKQTYKSEEHTKEVQMQRPRLIEVTLDY